MGTHSCFLHHLLNNSDAGEVQSIAGTGESGFKDGISVISQFNCPRGIDIDQQTGDIYVADHFNHVIRKISKGTVILQLSFSCF